MKNKKTFTRQIISLMPVFLCEIIFGCSGKWMPNIMFFLTKPNYQPPFTFSECTNISCANEMGKLFFIIPGSFLPEKFGRKIIIICCLFLHCFTWAILSTCKSIILIYISRFVSGIAEGLFITTSLMMVGELSSAEFRGIFSSLLNVAYIIGELFECIINAIFESYDILTYSTMILSFCCLPALYWCIESPYFLLRKEKYEKARDVLGIIQPNYSEQEFNRQFEILKQSSCADKIQKNEYSFFGLLQLKSVRNPLLCVIIINMCYVGLGSAVINLYLTILPSNNYVSSSTYPLFSCIIILILSTNSILLVSKFSRRSLFIFCGFLSFFTHSNNAITCYLYHNAFEGMEFWKWSFIAGNFFALTISRTVLSFITDAIKAELLPYNVKGIGNGICIVFKATATVILFKIYEVCQQYSCLYVVFVIFAVNSVILILFVYLSLPETRDKSLVEVQDHFKQTDKEYNSEKINY